MTPRKSLDEFLANEKWTEKEVMPCDDLKDNRCESFEYKETSAKRLPSNLTPLSSIPKKRHTIKISRYDNNEETVKSNTSNTKINDAGLHSAKDDMYDINENETSMHNMSNHHLSGIPLPLSSCKGIETSIHSDIHNVGEVVEQSICNYISEENECITESIQEIRKASTIRKHESLFETNEQINSSEIRRTYQHSKFEDNPITISDVSVYFYDQKKVLVNQCDMTNIAPIDDIKCKSFCSRYMNLSCDSPLENIDQTRISLVETLSDEDDDECEVSREMNTGDVACNDLPDKCNQIEINSPFLIANEENNMLVPQLNTNDLHNVPSICRKCKSCQKTFINESTSNTANSFVLPSLPSAPILEMNRLIRLRSRPHITDVNGLWERSSLNCNIINLNNISHEESITFSDNIIVDFHDVSNIIRIYKSDCNRWVDNILFIYKGRYWMFNII